MDIVRHVETQASQYAQVLSGSAFAGDMSLTLPDADKVMVIMRLLPDSVREYVQLHGSYGSFAEVRSAVDQYDQKLRALGSGLLNAVHQRRSTPRGSRQGSRESRGGDRGRTSSRDRGDRGDRGGGKDRGRGKSSSPSPSPSKKPTGCCNCGDPKHLSRDCPKPMKCRNCGQEGHIAKDCPQPLRKASPEKEKKGKGKGKSKFRQVEEGSEPEEEAVEESTAGAGGETFMAVRSSSESRAVETADLVSSRDSYRVESVRILKPPGDECFTWLVDSGGDVPHRGVPVLVVLSRVAEASGDDDFDGSQWNADRSAGNLRSRGAHRERED